MGLPFQIFCLLESTLCQCVCGRLSRLSRGAEVHLCTFTIVAQIGDPPPVETVRELVAAVAQMGDQSKW